MENQPFDQAKSLDQARSIDLAIIGGGAAGFFAAITAAEQKPGLRIAIFERSSQFLSKVRVSGEGRCNLTYACFEPAQLVKFYPRGGAELRGPFTRFQPRDTMAWFERHGVVLKTDADGRVYPASDSARTIADCLLENARSLGVELYPRAQVESVRRTASWDGTRFELRLREGPGSGERSGGNDHRGLRVHNVLITTGGEHSGYDLARSLGHTVLAPVPSLFTFEIAGRDERIVELEDLTVEDAELSFPESGGSRQRGSVVVIRSGLAGSGVLKLSAWEARFLSDSHYRADLLINWLPGINEEQAYQTLSTMRETKPKQRVTHFDPFNRLPQRLWRRLSLAAGVVDLKTWADVSRAQQRKLAGELCACHFQVTGRGDFKEEFVTCGGVELKEVNFKTMESRLCPGLYFAGEVLDVDGLNGGFNFQNAWTTAFLAVSAITG
jgi:predicted Rossmann fold flavoprotein